MDATESRDANPQQAGHADGLPPRARALLNALQKLVEHHLQAPLVQCMQTLEEQLLNQARTSNSGDRQQQLSTQARAAAKLAPAFSADFLHACRDALTTLSEPTTAIIPVPRTGQLSLVDDVSIDSDIVLRDICRRELSRHTDALNCLAQRLAVISGTPVWEMEKLPLGPQWLIRRLSEVGTALPIEPATTLRLYQVYSTVMLAPVAQLLSDANALLARERILPGLEQQPYPARVPGTRRRNPTIAASPSPTTDAPTASENTNEPSAADVEAYKKAMSIANSAGTPRPWIDTLQDELRGEMGTAQSTEQALIVLQQLLSMALGAQRDTDLPTTGNQQAIITGKKLVQLLDRLHTMTAQSPHAGHRSIEDVRTALLAQARSEAGGQARLSARDDHHIGLINLLYQNIRKYLHADSPATDLLAQLQLPLLRTALEDGKFFVRAEHPLRELLNVVAENGAIWHLSEDIDPQLFPQLAQTVQRVVDEYQTDEQAFSKANEYIQAHLTAAGRRAELAERRFIEAARGKERMAVARKQAQAAIEQACATTATTPTLVARVLRQAWTDVLMLTLLRQGEGSEKWQSQLTTTARIIAITSQPAGSSPVDNALFELIQENLSQVGCLGEEAESFATCLSTPGGTTRLLATEKLERCLQSRSRLGAASDTGSGESGNAARTPEEEDCYQQLLSLPHGHWFDQAGSQPDQWRRLRLSWFSQISGNALFVNPRGQRISEPSLDQVARDMAAGHLRLVDTQQLRLIDRAWKETLHTLRQQASTTHREVSA